MNMQQSRKRILLVCGGNTCRSPMAKVILEQKLSAIGLGEKFEIDSAAYDGPTSQGASTNAREAIKKLYKQDLLAAHRAKKLAPELADWADVILVMGARMKRGLSPGKTWTMMEYAGGSGDVADPFGGGLDTYLKCAKQISDALDCILPKLTRTG